MNRQAFCYLKPAETLEKVKRKNRYGLAKIRFDKLKAHIPAVASIAGDIVEQSEKQGRPVHCFFTLSEAGVNAIQGLYANRWLARKVEEGIWALFYA